MNERSKKTPAKPPVAFSALTLALRLKKRDRSNKTCDVSKRVREAHQRLRTICFELDGLLIPKATLLVMERSLTNEFVCLRVVSQLSDRQTLFTISAHANGPREVSYRFCAGGAAPVYLHKLRAAVEAIAHCLVPYLA